MTIIHGDCLEIMKTFPDNHFRAIVTDPPYGLKFMGKEWDHGIPGTPYWEEALRISKPGTFLLAFGGTRTYHRLTCVIEDAGWEIRDCLMWLYGSGFPKGKGCLKPAWEPIILARKKGPNPKLNIDECRIECHSRPLRTSENGKRVKTLYKGGFGGSQAIGETSKGRWPANLIFDEEAGQMLDEQSGISKSRSGGFSGSNANPMSWHENNKNRKRISPDDSGGASRFFYCSKVSPSERNGSTHPTMKPIRLMEYLIKLVMPPQGLLLDPFAGSGTTILAAKNLGFEAIGIEKEEEYCKIATQRLILT